MSNRLRSLSGRQPSWTEDYINAKCALIEKNNPSFKEFHLHYCLPIGGPSHFYLLSRDIKLNTQIIYLYHHDTLKRFGHAIGNHSHVTSLTLHHLSAAAANARYAASIIAFCDEVKNNTSITTLNISGIRRSHDLVLDLNYFVRNNKNLKHLSLGSMEALSDRQYQMIAAAIEMSNLKSLVMNVFRHSGASLEMISSCRRVDSLKIIGCETGESEQFAAVASLLQNQGANKLTKLNLEIRFGGKGLSLIADALVDNKTLEELTILSPQIQHWEIDSFGSTLCNASSIETMVHSNHTLQKLIIQEVADKTVTVLLPKFINTCLELNSNANKDEVIRSKIAIFYFVGDFDVSSFVGMPISLVPTVMGLIEGSDTNRQSAIFRLLKNLPELCNVSSRDAGSEVV